MIINGKERQADEVRALFWWWIYFRKPYTRFYANGMPKIKMKGYGKFEGDAPNLDDDDNFCARVKMLIRCKYVADCEFIEIHRRPSQNLRCMADDPIFVTLYPNHFEIPPDKFKTFPINCHIFLKNEYKIIRSGIQPVRNLVPKQVKEKDQLYFKTGFRTWEEVYAHAQLLKDHGITANEIAGFIRREIDKITYGNGRTGQPQRI